MLQKMLNRAAKLLAFLKKVHENGKYFTNFQSTRLLQSFKNNLFLWLFQQIILQFFKTNMNYKMTA